MAIVAGVDEAGFGPKLGPLVMSGVAFRVPDGRADQCLWQNLHASCTRTPGRNDRRLAVADSKVLYRDRLAPLELAALVMLAVNQHRPPSWYALLNLIAPQAADSLKACAWYSSDFTLPIDDEVGDVATRANAVRREMAERQIEMLPVFSEPLGETEFNQQVYKTRNKAAVNLSLALRVIDRILRAADGAGSSQSSEDKDRDVRVFVDRLGGRTHYREALSASFPEFSMQVIEESSERSAYRMIGARRTCQVEFAVGGESRHFATALASIFSKYVRELSMHAFNLYWSAQVAGLRPTAGYTADADRWLRDAGPVLARMSVCPAMLVRQR